MRQHVKRLAINFFSHLLIDDRVTSWALTGYLLRDFYQDRVGSAYGLSHSNKRRLVREFQEINERVPSATQWPCYVLMARAILEIPRAAQGQIVECGAYKGASSAALSLISKIVGRKLTVCDSFAGLPADEHGAHHTYPHLGVSTKYGPGDFCGSLLEVRANIEKYGDISSCDFLPWFFSKSLASLRGPIVFAFLDVDLASSMRDCITHLWPLLAPGGLVFTDDSCDMELARLWFDSSFWSTEVGCAPPGYVGSGCGLPALSARYSSLGYTGKFSDEFRNVSFLSPSMNSMTKSVEGSTMEPSKSL